MTGTLIFTVDIDKILDYHSISFRDSLEFVYFDKYAEKNFDTFNYWKCEQNLVASFGRDKYYLCQRGEKLDRIGILLTDRLGREDRYLLFSNTADMYRAIDDAGTAKVQISRLAPSPGMDPMMCSLDKIFLHIVQITPIAGKHLEDDDYVEKFNNSINLLLEVIKDSSFCNYSYLLRHIWA